MAIYDLEERTFQFAKEVRLYIKTLPKTVSNYEDIKQLVRASGSIGANYIEANESLGDKDFLFKLRISRREAKESGYFLRLIYETNDSNVKSKGEELHREVNEIRRIISSIIGRSDN